MNPKANSLKELIRISIALAQVEFKLKIEGSYLGIFWYLINPLLTCLLLITVFSNTLGQSIVNYPLYLLFGIIIFNFFRNITTESCRVIYNHRALIKSIKFPLESLLLASILKTFYSHFIELIVFSIFLGHYNIPLVNILPYFVILILFSSFIYGLALLLSAFNVYFMDLDNIWQFVLQLLWFATPIFYSIENHSLLHLFNLFNPMYYFITISRDIVIYSRVPPYWMFYITLGFTIVSLFVGAIVFNKLKNKFTNLI